MPPPPPSRVSARDVLSDSASGASLPSPTTASLTQKLHDFATRTLLPRLATDVSTVPEGYGRTQSGPSPGAVVGIVLGSIAGFVLLLWIIYFCVNLGGSSGDIEEGSVGAGGSSSVVSYRSRPRIHRHSRRSHSEYSPSTQQQQQQRRTKETIEITRRDRRRPSVSSRSRTPERRDQIVVMEENGRSSSPRSTSITRSRSRSRSMSISRPRPPPPPHPDDEIIVLEEHTPPRRQSRNYRRQSSERRTSAVYRDDRYGSSRDMSRRRSSSRR
ncbi:hypothetical protein M426DRAFT_317210 [Hypoxylon sp. CI-4A]|nr:hypothetical protein M426DRAFT_317210 [Hypoxylon sp. CI-4A]